MSRRLPLGEGETARIACARGLLRCGVEEKTGRVLAAAELAQRVGWAADLVSGMAAGLLAERWNAADVDALASGVDAGGRAMPSNAWMALRRLGWTAAPAGGLRGNDRIVRMAQEQAGRTLRSVKWRADVTAGVRRDRRPGRSGAGRPARPGPSAGGARAVPGEGAGGPGQCGGDAVSGSGLGVRCQAAVSGAVAPAAG